MIAIPNTRSNLLCSCSSRSDDQSNSLRQEVEKKQTSWTSTGSHLHLPHTPSLPHSLHAASPKPPRSSPCRHLGIKETTPRTERITLRLPAKTKRVIAKNKAVNDGTFDTPDNAFNFGAREKRGWLNLDDNDNMYHKDNILGILWYTY